MEIEQARSMAKLGIWMVEKCVQLFIAILHHAKYIHRQLTLAMGQPSSIQETNCWPASPPIVPSIEYSLWPPSGDNSAPQMTSSCMSNFQYACELLRIVLPVLDEM